MPVTIKVNGTANSLVHKGSNGISTATIPDVCKTPTPGGPVPLPYPNISQSATLDKGTKTVKADGGMMIAIKGSEFSMSNGDEPGSIGGVKSNTFIKESTWILYSFDVKMEGEGTCRLTDKKFQNHENTADMGGIIQVPVLVEQTDPECTVACAIICCDEAEYTKDVHPDKGDGMTPAEKDCTSLSRTKHSCVLHSLRKRSGKSATAVNKFDNIEASPPKLTALVDGVVKPAIPDIIVNKDHVIDAKFPCDKSKPSAPLKRQQCTSANKRSSKMDTKKEDTVYTEIQERKIEKSEAMTPEDARERLKDNNCKACDCKYEDA
jgi:Domain of unknown function (DUF4150)